MHHGKHHGGHGRGHHGHHLGLFGLLPGARLLIWLFLLALFW